MKSVVADAMKRSSTSYRGRRSTPFCSSFFLLMDKNSLCVLDIDSLWSIDIANIF